MMRTFGSGLRSRSTLKPLWFAGMLALLACDAHGGELLLAAPA